MIDIDIKRERSFVVGRAMAEEWNEQEMFHFGISHYLIEQSSLQAWAEVVADHDIFCDEFVLGFKERAVELTRD